MDWITPLASLVWAQDNATAAAAQILDRVKANLVLPSSHHSRYYHPISMKSLSQLKFRSGYLMGLNMVVAPVALPDWH
jgi:hypothetical protein